MKYLKLILIILFLLIFNLKAETFVADTCSQADVQAAVDLASTGDTVIVPAGECEWASAVDIDDANKIILQGAGIGSTVITRSSAGTVVGLGTSGSRVTGFSFDEGTVRPEGIGWRVDHCSFTSTSFTNGVFIRGNSPTGVHSEGLIDNCTFHNQRVEVDGSLYQMSEGEQQNILWTDDLDLGTTNAVIYIEDCDFEYTVFGNAIDSTSGGAYVFRFNTLTDVYIEAHSSQANRAIRKWEVYNNTFTNPGSSIYYPYRIRGGTGVIFNQSISGNWSNTGVAFDNVRSYTDYGGTVGQCDGSSDWDGNEDEFGYPCRDQIGRGPDDPQWQEDPVGEYTQPLVPAYVWENREADTSLASTDVLNVSTNHIKANRDFYAQNESFDGTSGMGVGTLASIPATCTTGVGYWATDQGDWNTIGDDGVLYKCTSTDTWEVYYEPYTYPHPLRDEAAVTCFGDANLSGTITIADVVAVLKHIAETAVLEGTALANADADGSGTIDGDDVTRILQHITGANPLPGCE